MVSRKTKFIIKFRTGLFYSVSYALTLMVMIYSWKKEYVVLKRFSRVNRIPFRNLLIISGVFAMSYSVRTILNFIALIDAPLLIGLQQNSC